MGKAGRILMIVVALAAIGGGGFAVWKILGGPYGDSCKYFLGCQSFACLQHELSGVSQVSSEGHCTKECATDAECGAGASCVVLSEQSRNDLPPFAKPERACMVVRDTPSDIRQ